MNISNNTILITGGATGIGLALAHQFVAAGNEVVVCGRRLDKLEEAKALIPQLHTKVADVSSEYDRINLITWMVSNFPGFNMLVNNAGIQNAIGLQVQHSSERLSSEIDTNLLAPIHLSNLVVPHFMHRQEAAIVNITSGLAFIPLAATAVYCATKAALHSFSQSARFQLKDTPIKVFAIAPPLVTSDLGKDEYRAGRNVEGMTPEAFATEAIQAIASDQYNCAAGMAVNLYQAATNGRFDYMFDLMNKQ